MKMRSAWVLMALFILMAVPLVTSAQDSGSPYEPKLPVKTGVVRSAAPTSASDVIALPPAADAATSSDTTGVDAPAVAPGNDNFANATVINSLPFNDVSVTEYEDATREVDEVVASCYVGQFPSAHSVWYRYTPASDVAVTIDLDGASFDTVVAVYTGNSVSNLNEIACNDDISVDLFVQSLLVEVNLIAATTYYIQVSEYNLNEPLPNGSTLDMSVFLTPDPINVAVNTFNDSTDTDFRDGTCQDSGGNCSLRAAIMEANYRRSGSQITLGTGTYTLTLEGDDDAAQLGDIDITQGVTITGAGANKTIIDAAGIDSHFEIYDASVTTLTGMTLMNGFRDGDGGAVRAEGSGTIVSFNEVVLIDNEALKFGGGLAVDSAVVNANNLSVVNNTSGTSGGGMTLISSTDNNDILVPSTTNLDNVTVSGNTATLAGGGIAVRANSVLNTNNVTVGANISTTDIGGGIHLQGSSALAFINNTLVGVNSATANADCFGNFDSQGNNLIGSAIGCSGFVGTDLLDQDPGMDVAAYRNGPGVTYTQRITASSPARNAGDPATCETTDQRGVVRGANCDIGAIEFLEGVPSAITLTSPANNTVYDVAADPTEFTWTKATSNGYNYLFTLTKVSGSGAGQVLQANLNALDVCGASTCTLPFNLDLDEAGYRWSVSVISDEASITAENNPFVFTIGRPVVDIARNGGFENFVNRRTINNWTIKAGSKPDKIMCDKDTDGDGIDDRIFALDGECAFQFKGSATEKTRLIQNTNISIADIQKDDTININVFADARSSVANLRVVFRAIYGDGTVSKVVVPVKTTSGYTEFSGELLILRKNTTKVKIVLNHRSKSGKVYVDTVQVYAPGNPVATLPETATGVDALPLPEAPANFKR